MTLKRLDHVNIRTNNLAKMVDWYGEVLDLLPGWRPNFPFGGAWLYLGDQPVIHLVEKDSDNLVDSEADLRLEHMAFAGEGLKEFEAKLERLNIPYDRAIIPHSGTVQINIWDADKNHLHVDFKADE